ncbi:MAG: dTMP kinase [Deltaproteobacteria bacterium]|nr:dTMP kinase [Deltaproteobacteria bacterium]
MRGLFIAVEGIDGSGTTTFIKNVAQFLRNNNFNVHVTTEPSSHTVGRYIRERLGSGKGDNTILGLLFAADRVIHFREEINPLLEKGYIVISDRYILSSLAYQGVDEELSWLEQINSRAQNPDLTIFIEVDELEGEKRISKRGSKRDVTEKLDFQKKVVQNYNILKNQMDVILDGFLSPEKLSELGVIEILKKIRST